MKLHTLSLFSLLELPAISNRFIESVYIYKTSKSNKHIQIIRCNLSISRGRFEYIFITLWYFVYMHRLKTQWTYLRSSRTLWVIGGNRYYVMIYKNVISFAKVIDSFKTRIGINQCIWSDSDFLKSRLLQYNNIFLVYTTLSFWVCHISKYNPNKNLLKRTFRYFTFIKTKYHVIISYTKLLQIFNFMRSAEPWLIFWLGASRE